MKRLVATLAVFLCTLSTPVLAAPSWVTVAQRVMQSVVALRTFGDQIYCSGFVINDEKDLIMTAAHCTEYGQQVGMRVDRSNSWVVWESRELDAAVLHAPGVNRPALRPGGEVTAGQPTASFGYGYGWPSVMFRAGEVSHPAAFILNAPDPATASTPWILFSYSVIPGMSGGPTVDDRGRVVSMNQIGNDVISAGKSIVAIYAESSNFWEGD